MNASKNIKIKNIKIIDSYSASVGLGLLAIYAVDLKQSGKSYNQIVKAVEVEKDNIQLFLLLNDLTYIARGGRLPSEIKTIANLFRLTPVLGNKKGKISARGVLFGKKKRVEKMVKFLGSKIKEDKKYHIMIAHANDLKNGEKLLNLLLTKHRNITKHYLVELGGGLGAHAGPGGLAIGIQERE